LTPRGAGTGNYGQCVPLQGGLVIDMVGMAQIISHGPGFLRVEAGARMVDIDASLAPAGWELRMHPSTKRTATIGGFVAGGSGGVGSINYGGLREPGNILGARIVTVEREPRVLDLSADAAQKVNRAYGTTGIITRLDMPLAPKWDWVDVVVAFKDYATAIQVGHEIALADGLVKKLVCACEAPLPRYFNGVASKLDADDSILICMIASPFLPYFKALVGGRGGVVHEEAFDESPGHTPAYEYTWNHATLNVLKTDRGVTYLQCLFPHDRLLDSVRETSAMLGAEQMQHLEFIRFGGRLTASALPVIRYSSPARINEIISAYEERGVFIANPHVVTLEDGSRHKRADADQLGFKHEVDPQGLLNPGKMRTFTKHANQG
jgi:FAD/FMN-containing dehydrogenase